MGTTEKRLQIVCGACGADTFLKREPVYEGFRKTGERLRCADCGHEYADPAAVPYKGVSGPRVFTDADRSKVVQIFRGDERGRNCRHCRHYVVSPFVQRCGLHNIEVQATDLCDRFAAKANDDEDLRPPREAALS
jgi:hypothetical protein